MTKADIFTEPSSYRLPSISFDGTESSSSSSFWTPPPNPHLPIQLRNTKTYVAHNDINTVNWSNSNSNYQKIESVRALMYPVKMENDIESEEGVGIITNGDSFEGSRSCSPIPSEAQLVDEGSGSKPLKIGDSKICGVCGDKALGNNFNAITCESCKAFFRRNAKKNKEFVCPFSNNCKVDPVTRRFCQKCRLKKCFDIGMIKEWIMTDEEKKVKKQKIELNRLKRQSSDVPADAMAPLPKAACMISDQVTSNNNNSNNSSPTMTGTNNAISTAGNGGIIQRISQNSTIQHPVSPPDPTLPHKVLKQPMMPHSSYSYENEHGQNGDYLTEVQFKDNSNSSSPNSSSNSSSFPPPSPQTGKSRHPHHSHNHSHQQDIEMAQGPATNSSSSNNNNKNNNSANGINIFSSNNNSSNNHSSDPQSFSPMNANNNSNNNQFSFNLQSSSTSSSSSSNPVLNSQSQMPLLSSLMRPGVAESPPDYELYNNSNNSNSSSGSNNNNNNGIPVSSPPAIPPHPQHPAFDLLGSSHHSQSPLNGGHNVIMSNSHQNSHPTHPAQHHIQQGQSSFPPTPVASTIQIIQPTESNNLPHHHHSNSSQVHGSIAEVATDGVYEQDSCDSYSSVGESQAKRVSLGIINDVVGKRSGEHERTEPDQSISPKTNYDEDDADRPLPLNTMNSILSVAITAEFSAFGVLSCGQPGRQINSRLLNKAEQNKLNELLVAGTALNTPVDAEGPVKVSDPSLINVINLTDIAIRRLIKMAKRVSAFKQLCSDDQVALLKGSCTEMMILRSVVSYDPDRDSWNIPHSKLGYNIKLGVLKEARGNLYEEHQRFVKNFKSEWRKDENIMIILCAITLFTAERPNVIHKDVVKLEQDSYYYLLKRYLESIYDGCEARSTYLQLIKKIAELHVLNSNHLRVFLEVNPREVGPLLIEIFDLK